MKIGIIIPVWNRLIYIENCLTTCKEQTYPSEVYVVDDNSDDGTWKYLMDHPNLYTQAERNETRKGWAPTLNRAAELAIADGCEALFVMASDDFLRLDCISKCYSQLRQGKDWCVVWAQQVGEANVLQVSKDDATLADFDRHPPLVNYALIPSKIWQEVGGYPEDAILPDSYGFKEDWAFWIEVFRRGYTNYGVVKEPVYYYFMHPEQLHRPGLSRYEEAKKVILEKHPLEEYNV